MFDRTGGPCSVPGRTRDAQGAAQQAALQLLQGHDARALPRGQRHQQDHVEQHLRPPAQPSVCWRSRWSGARCHGARSALGGSSSSRSRQRPARRWAPLDCDPPGRCWGWPWSAPATARPTPQECCTPPSPARCPPPPARRAGKRGCAARAARPRGGCACAGRAPAGRAPPRRRPPPTRAAAGPPAAASRCCHWAARAAGGRCCAPRQRRRRCRRLPRLPPPPCRLSRHPGHAQAMICSPSKRSGRHGECVGLEGSTLDSGWARGEVSGVLGGSEPATRHRCK